jgi:hypothetical protein
LYSFREENIHRGQADYLRGLESFDFGRARSFWLLPLNDPFVASGSQYPDENSGYFMFYYL